MKNVFIETLSKFSDNPEDEKLSKVVWGEYTFSLLEVVGYNKTSDGFATVDLKNGDRWAIAIRYNNFVELMKDNFDHITVIDAKANYEFKEQ